MTKDGAGSVVIDLMGGFGDDNVQAVLTGPGAGAILAHFQTLADFAIRDAFAYGVLAGLTYAADGKGKRI